MRERPPAMDANPSDVLTDVLAGVRLHGTLFCRAILRSPWGFKVPARTPAVFHYVASGKCWLEVDGLRNDIQLAGRDLVILPYGNAHTLRDRKSSPHLDLQELLCANPLKDNCDLEFGGNGKSAVLLCGGFVIENARANPLLASLPAVLHIVAKRLKSFPELRKALDWVKSEVNDRGFRSEPVTNRLSEILFIEALRAHCADCETASSGWVRALADPYLGSALALIHQEPESDWQVGEIARQLGISRSSFASKFERLVGEPPMQYVIRCRLGKAARLLQTSHATIPEIAGLVGYASVAGFCKAFKRFYEATPGEFRRAADPTRRMKNDWLRGDS